MSMQDRIEDLRRRREEIEQGGGADKLDKQRQSGKLTARERITALVDTDTFDEVGQFASHNATLFGMAGKKLPADGVITGAAAVGGRLVHVASQDFTVAGGSAGEMHSVKIAESMREALRTGSPFVFINDSGGARVQEGIGSLSGYGQVFHANVLLSGVVPQVALICGPCAGGAAYSPALTDFIIQTRQGQLCITGPQVIKQVTGEGVDICFDNVGGVFKRVLSGEIRGLAVTDVERSKFLPDVPCTKELGMGTVISSSTANPIGSRWMRSGNPVRRSYVTCRTWSGLAMPCATRSKSERAVVSP